MGSWRVLTATLDASDSNPHAPARIAEVTVVDEDGRQLILEVDLSYLEFAKEIGELNPEVLRGLELPAAAIRAVRKL